MYHAHVTAVAGPGQEDSLSSLGADVVIDYHRENVLKSEETFDVVLDLATTLRYSDIRHVLSDAGRFIPSDPFKNEADFVEGTESAQRTRYLFVSKGNRADLEIVADWVDAGLLETHIESRFDFEDFEKGLERLQARTKRGRIVLRMTQEE